MAKRTAESYLQIHLSEGWPDDNRIRWSRRAGSRVEDGACALREVPTANEITAIAPAARVAFARASLPRGLAPKLARFAPYAIEDAIAPSPESVRTALIRDLSGGGWLGASRLFPPLMVHMIASREASGRLAEMLDRTATQSARELERRIAAFVALLEPLLIFAMGAIVLVIVLAILLPIFGLNQIVR
jgi:general secretion pathway protein F